MTDPPDEPTPRLDAADRLERVIDALHSDSSLLIGDDFEVGDERDPSAIPEPFYPLAEIFTGKYAERGAMTDANAVFGGIAPESGPSALAGSQTIYITTA